MLLATARANATLGPYLRCVTWFVSSCCVCWWACTVRSPPITASGSTIEDPFVMACRRTPQQIATAAWGCAQTGRRCAAPIKVFAKRPVKLLLLLSQYAATTRQTPITVDSAAESALKGFVWLVSVLTLVSPSCWRCSRSVKDTCLPSHRCVLSKYMFAALFLTRSGRMCSWAHTHTVKAVQATMANTAASIPSRRRKAETTREKQHRQQNFDGKQSITDTGT